MSAIPTALHDRVPNALLFGGGMLAFYLLLLAWIVMTCLWLKRAGDRSLVRRFCLILCSLQIALGPGMWIYYWTERSLAGLSAARDPYQQGIEAVDAGVASLVVMSTGSLLLCVTGLLVGNRAVGEA